MSNCDLPQSTVDTVAIRYSDLPEPDTDLRLQLYSCASALDKGRYCSISSE